MAASRRACSAGELAAALFAAGAVVDLLGDIDRIFLD
jgi:hypothetical protein